MTLSLIRRALTLENRRIKPSKRIMALKRSGTKIDDDDWVAQRAKRFDPPPQLLLNGLATLAFRRRLWEPQHLPEGYAQSKDESNDFLAFVDSLQPEETVAVAEQPKV